MRNKIYLNDPDVDRFVVINRDRAGRRRVVMDMDADLSEPYPQDYPMRIIKRVGEGPARVYGKRSRKKQTRMLRPMERVVRKGARRGIRILQDYLYLHERANRKRKNGWLRQYRRNLRKAIRRSAD